MGWYRPSQDSAQCTSWRAAATYSPNLVYRFLRTAMGHALFQRIDFLVLRCMYMYNAQDHQIVVPLLTANGVVEHVYFSKGALYWIR